jgi:hypothetical protein
LATYGGLGVEFGRWVGVLRSGIARPVIVWLLVHVFVLVFVRVCVVSFLYWVICPLFLLVNPIIHSSEKIKYYEKLLLRANESFLLSFNTMKP